MMTMVVATSENAGTVLRWLESFGQSPWVLALALVGATLFSEDLTCISAGILVAKDWLPFFAATTACSLGIWLGDLGLYGLGRLAARTQHWKWVDRVVTPERVAKGQYLFDVYGVRWIFLSRFLPGTRLPSYVAAGVVGWSFRRYAGALAVAALLWTPILCGLAFFAGRTVLVWLESYQKWVWPILIGAALFLWLLVRNILPLFSWRGRRLLRSRWGRLRQWEFWPVWAVYPPVVLYLAWQAMRLRGGFLFTCCNPSMPHSGLAMESKGDILDALQCPEESRIRVAKYCRIQAAQPGSGSDRVASVRQFLAEENLTYPVVLKPDVGERGQGVAIVRDQEGVRRWLEAYHGEAIAQEYVDGLEFGVQWCRYPGDGRGEIPSLTGKFTQDVVGDGQRTLERLILDDARGVMMGNYYLTKFEPQLEKVLARGERFPLTEIGTHARGAVFTDERRLVTDELREALEEVSRSYEGFYLGRYDLRAPSVEDFQAGRRLAIIELNGVSGEPIHIYATGYPWWKGVRDLCGHWKRACEIGAANRARGARPSTLREMWCLARLHWKENWFEADRLLESEPDAKHDLNNGERGGGEPIES